MGGVRWADLRAVTVTAERGSLSAAARRLDCSPSAVSQSVSRVERYLGTTLLHRQSHRVEPTTAGRVLLKIVGELSSSWTSALAQAAAIDGRCIPTGDAHTGATTGDVPGSSAHALTPPDASEADAFLLTVATGSFTAAARQLYLTPRAVSARVARVERTLGLRLLTRTTHGVAVTAAGRVVADALTHLHSRWQDASAGLQVAGAPAAALMPASLRVALYSLAVHTLLDHLASRWPSTTVTSHEYDSDLALDDLLNGTVDIVIGYEINDPMPSVPAPLRRVRLVTEHCRLAVGEGHLLLDRFASSDSHPTLAELSDQVWVLPPDGPLREAIEKACEAAGFTPRCDHAVTDVSAVRGLLHSLRAITFCAPTVPALGQLRVVPVHGAPTRTLFLAWNPDLVSMPVMRECAAAFLQWYRERARMNNPDYARYLEANPSLIADSAIVCP